MAGGSADISTTATGDWEQGEVRRVQGKELVKLSVTLPQHPASQLIEYRKV